MSEVRENKVRMSGYVKTKPRLDHEFMGENFYTFILEIKRNSGCSDYLPVILPESEFSLGNIGINDYLLILGQIRSYNVHSENGSHLKLFIFANNIEKIDDIGIDDNYVYLFGTLVSIGNLRETPLHRIITDTTIAINRRYGKSDYLPVIFWGRSAKDVSALSVGDAISITGRFQSRQYKKYGIDMMAYEISAYEIMYNKDKTMPKSLMS